MSEEKSQTVTEETAEVKKEAPEGAPSHEGAPHRAERPERGPGMDGDRKRPAQRRYRKRVLDTRNISIDYKNSEVLERFISRTGKILPRRMTGATAKVQRKIAREIKRSRMIQILPITRH